MARQASYAKECNLRRKDKMAFSTCQILCMQANSAKNIGKDKYCQALKIKFL